MLSQFYKLFELQIALLFRDKERLVSPILFAVTVLLLFAFAQVSYESEKQKIAIMTAQTFLCLLFAVQVALFRSLEPDKEDCIFDIMRTMPISAGIWFVSRSVVSVVLCLTVAVPVLIFSFLFHSDIAHLFINGFFLVLVILVSFGLAFLGTILSILTFHADGRELLFPLLFFPLAIPVLLTGIVGSASIFSENAMSWIGLALGFDIIYFTLGVLLFDEFVGPV